MLAGLPGNIFAAQRFVCHLMICHLTAIKALVP